MLGIRIQLQLPLAVIFPSAPAREYCITLSVPSLWSLQIPVLMVRSLDLILDNTVERVQALRLGAHPADGGSPSVPGRPDPLPAGHHS